MAQSTTTIATIAELKLRKGVTGSNVVVSGYYTAGDGGGGQFYWDSTSTATDNGGTIFQVTSVTTGRWIRNYSSDIDIRCFGAKIDATTDNTTFIQKALNVSNVFIPSGICKIAGTITIPNNRRIKGEFGTTLLGIMTSESTGAYPNQMFVNSDTTSGNVNISFEKIKFDFAKGSYNYATGTGLTSINSLKFVKVNSLQFFDCEFFDFVTNNTTGRTGKDILLFGMSLFDECVNVKLSNIKSSNIREEGLNFYQCKNIEINGWEAEGAVVNTSSHAGFWYCDGVSVKNSTFIHTGGSVLNCCSSNVVYENIIINKGQTQDGRGFDFGNELNAISYNAFNITVKNCYLNVLAYGVQNPSTLMDTTNISIIDNVFVVGVDTTASNSCFGIFVRGGLSCNISNNDITLSDVSVNGTGQCIQILAYENQSVNYIIKNNRLKGNTAVYLYYTGSSTITNLDIDGNIFISQNIGALTSGNGASTFLYYVNASGQTLVQTIQNISLRNNIATNIGGGIFYMNIGSPASVAIGNIILNKNVFTGILGNAARGCSFGSTGIVGNPILVFTNNIINNCQSINILDFNKVFFNNNYMENVTPMLVGRIQLYSHNDIFICNDNIFVNVNGSYNDVNEVTTGVYNVLQINRNISIRTITGVKGFLLHSNLTTNTFNPVKTTKLEVSAGSNQSIGTATLVSGTVTVSTTAVTTSSLIFVSYNTPSGTLAAGLSAPSASIVNGTSFVINSLTTAGIVNTLDTSTVRWWIVN